MSTAHDNIRVTTSVHNSFTKTQSTRAIAHGELFSARVRLHRRDFRRHDCQLVLALAVDS